MGPGTGSDEIRKGNEIRRMRKHIDAIDRKEIARRDHLGKYATARDISERIVEMKARKGE